MSSEPSRYVQPELSDARVNRLWGNVSARLEARRGRIWRGIALSAALSTAVASAVFFTRAQLSGPGAERAVLADAKLETVPVNFLSDLDITGGNSGSPVLDAHGRLVGLAFDGNWESVASNWVFDPTVTRMISVDQRYMRWVMQEVIPAPQLLAEMGVAPKQ